MNTNYRPYPKEDFNFMMDALKHSYSYIDTTYASTERAQLPENLNTEFFNLLYFRKWMTMGDHPLTPSLKKGGGTVTPSGKDTALHTATALDNLNAASAGFVTAIQVIPAVHDNLTNSISALIAAARKRPVDIAALIAASERVVAAAAAVEPATQQLIYSTATLTAAAKEVHYTTVPKSYTADLPADAVNKVQYFMNSCVNDKKLAA